MTATLSPTLMRELRRGLGGRNREVAEQNIAGIRITIREEREDFEASNHLICSHCDFIAHNAAQMTQHRWEVHPLLTRRKQHLMTSPKGGRKRPNSESSEEGRSAELEDVAPKKKLSPNHVMMTSCNSDVVCTHVRRTSSADEVLKSNQIEVHGRRKSHSVGDLSSTKHFVTSHVRQSSEGSCKCDDLARSYSPSPSFDQVSAVSNMTSCRSDTENDLHTLARAALTAAPIPWKEVSNGTTQPHTIAQPWMAGFPQIDQSVYATNNQLATLATLAGPMRSLLSGQVAPSLLRGYFPDNARILPLSSSAFSRPNQAPFTVPGSYPPGPGLPLNLPLGVPPSPDPPQANKLSTLSHVASRYLTGNDASDDDLVQDVKTQERPTTLVDPDFSVSRVSAPRPCTRGPASEKKQQRHHGGKQAMDDDRVRSLEEALSKIDCCDPAERSNMLPYRCADGKWRMVRSKCVGGAWVVQVPGAVQPSIYVPLQRDSQQGTLDNWLKERLVSSPQRPGTKPHHAQRPQINPLTLQQQRCVADSPIKRMTTSGRIAGSIPVENGAIKSLLLKNTAVRS